MPVLLLSAKQMIVAKKVPDDRHCSFNPALNKVTVAAGWQN